MKKSLTALVISLCSLAPYSNSQTINGSGIYDPLGLIAPNQLGLATIGKGFGFTEGPAADSEGNVYFTDQPNDKIYRWDARSGEITLFAEDTGRANGMMFDKAGNLITCADMHGEIRKITPAGKQTVLINNYAGKLLNGPNDVWINPANGGMYFTDPMFPRDYWDKTDPRKQDWEPKHSEQAAVGKGGYVYYLPPGGTKLIRVTTEDMGWDSDGWPNGIVGTPDGKRLYVNKWFGDNKGGTWVFDIKSDGTLANMQKFTEWGGDGMSMDEFGNVYISNGRGVMAFDTFGNNILIIPTGGGATNNTFAGRHNKTLFITGPVDSVTGVQMRLKGSQ